VLAKDGNFQILEHQSLLSTDQHVHYEIFSNITYKISIF